MKVKESRLIDLLSLIQTELKVLLGEEKIRINVMAIIDNELTIVEHTNGFSKEELKLKLKENEGCAGKAWKNQVEVIADLTKAKDPRTDWDISEEEYKKINPRLKAIISIPIYGPSTYNSLIDYGVIIGVLNVDSESEIAGKFSDISKSVLGKSIAPIATFLEERRHG